MREASSITRNFGKKIQAHIHTEIFRDNPVPGQIMGCPVNIFFDYQKWIDEKLIDSITLRSSWFEALEDPPDLDSLVDSLSVFISAITKIRYSPTAALLSNGIESENVPNEESSTVSV